MTMMGGKTASGYTIVEVMIFLAITTVLFVIAMVAISGQQDRTNFSQGIRDFEASIEDTINDIRNGNFPKNVSYKCAGLPDGSISLTSIGTPSDQGTHQDCVFFGKVAQFGSSWREAKLYTVAGRRITTTGSDPRNFLEARPVIPTIAGFQETFPVLGGLNITKIIAKNKTGSSYPVWAIGFFSPFTDSADPTKPENNGLVTVVPIRNSGNNNVPAITTIVDGSVALPTSWTNNAATDANPERIIICLQQGGGGQRAAVILGQSDDLTSPILHVGDIDTATNSLITGIAGVTC